MYPRRRLLSVQQPFLTNPLAATGREHGMYRGGTRAIGRDPNGSGSFRPYAKFIGYLSKFKGIRRRRDGHYYCSDNGHEGHRSLDVCVLRGFVYLVPGDDKDDGYQRYNSYRRNGSRRARGRGSSPFGIPLFLQLQLNNFGLFFRYSASLGGILTIP